MPKYLLVATKYSLKWQKIQDRKPTGQGKQSGGQNFGKIRSKKKKDMIGSTKSKKRAFRMRGNQRHLLYWTDRRTTIKWNI